MIRGWFTLTILPWASYTFDAFVFLLPLLKLDHIFELVQNNINSKSLVGPLPAYSLLFIGGFLPAILPLRFG